MKKTVVILIVILAIVVLIVAPMRARKRARIPVGPSEAIYVNVDQARRGTMVLTVEVSGDIKALKTTTLSAKIPGRIVEIPYREGDLVHAGAIIARQDTSDLEEQVRQANAALMAAKARLSQAETARRVSQTQTEAQVAQASAALDAAKARLEMLEKGARSQEIASAENAVAAAKASFEHAREELERMKSLFSQGAVSKQQADLARMQYEVASAQYETAKEQFSLVKAGAREEEIEAARKQVAQAEESLRMAKANRAETALREQDVKAARAGVAQAEAALAYARQQVVNASITTPIAGTVSKRYAEPGQMASPGVPLMEIVALDSLYFEATVSEIDFGRLKVGQPVRITIDALPGEQFSGSLQKILPTADEKSRRFTVWIRVHDRFGRLKPGMFARGSIEVATHPNTVIVPKDALMSSGKDRFLYIVEGGVAKRKLVRIGFENRYESEILSGVSIGDRVVITGQDKLSDGVKVNVAD